MGKPSTRGRWPIFSLVKLCLLTGLLVFYAFWYIPTMRSLHAHRTAMDKAFGKSTDCWNEKYSFGDYIGANACYQSWDTWEARNPMPESGFNWPWYVWKESR